ncbi:serine--tRNA ligase [candidate division KSB1 bacterium]|nr:serine--tRNA ligase [candidate division KSB1 bacterium]
MLDLNYIRNHPDEVQRAADLKNIQIDLDRLLAVDQARRGLEQQLQEQSRLKNQLTLQISQLPQPAKAPSALTTQRREINQAQLALKPRLKALDEQIRALLLTIPNLLHPSVVPGQGGAANLVVKTWGASVATDFPRLPHWELGKALDLFDFEMGAKLAGSFFVNFRGWGARLVRALINFMLDLHVQTHGYIEVAPPLLARRQTLIGTGQLPLLESEMYRIERDDLFLIPTAEVPLTNLHQDEILAEEQLPRRYVAYTPCFRREAGTHGRENRGLVRMHQFDKIELVQFVRPEDSYAALEELREQAEKVLQLLELPYRVVQLCSGELSFASAKCYDLEVWAPAAERYLEVSSCCNFEAFQARRAKIRFRPGQGEKVKFVHTLNASGVALPRTLIALLENYQTDEKTVIVPRVLRPYLGTAIIKKN